MSKTVCYTGHRPQQLGSYNPKDLAPLLWEIRKVTVEHIEKGFDTFISGMALGIDTYAAQIVLKLKQEISTH